MSAVDVPVLRPDGTLIALSVTAAARLLGVSRQTVYNASEATAGGRRLRYLPDHDRAGAGRRPVARIRLPDGSIVVGWAEASAQTGRRRRALQAAALQDDDGVWRVAQHQAPRDRRPPRSPCPERAPSARAVMRETARAWLLDNPDAHPSDGARAIGAPLRPVVEMRRELVRAGLLRRLPVRPFAVKTRWIRVPVYAPDGRRIADTVAEASTLLGVSYNTIRYAGVREPNGWHLRYVPGRKRA